MPSKQTTRDHLKTVEAAVKRGMDPDEIESTLLKPLKLGHELMATLWLYAWTLKDRLPKP